MAAPAGQPLVALQDRPMFKAGIRTCVCVYRESDLEIETMMATVFGSLPAVWLAVVEWRSL